MALPWTAPERRWRDVLLVAMLPGLEARALGSFFERFQGAAPLLLRVGLRAAVWVLAWLPVLSTGLRLDDLPPGDRDAFVQRALASNWYLVRQCATTVKVVACLAYFREPSARVRYLGAA